MEDYTSKTFYPSLQFEYSRNIEFNSKKLLVEIKPNQIIHRPTVLSIQVASAQQSPKELRPNATIPKKLFIYHDHFTFVNCLGQIFLFYGNKERERNNVSPTFSNKEHMYCIMRTLEHLKLHSVRCPVHSYGFEYKLHIRGGGSYCLYS